MRNNEGRGKKWLSFFLTLIMAVQGMPVWASAENCPDGQHQWYYDTHDYQPADGELCGSTVSYMDHCTVEGCEVTEERSFTLPDHTAGEPRVLDAESKPASCVAPGKRVTVTECTRCGQELSRQETELPAHGHLWISSEPFHDATHHWYECMECHEKIGYEEHHALCNKPDECVVCNVEYHGEKIDPHYYSSDPVTNDTHHWYACLNCGAKLNEEEHHALCNNPTECAVCGEQYNGRG